MECGLLKLHHLLGKKWTYGLLYNITDKPISFSGLDALSNKTMNPTLLTQRLAELVEMNIIAKKKVGNHSYFSMTSTGNELKSALEKVKDVASKLGCSIPDHCKHNDCSGCKAFRKVHDLSV